MRCFWLNDAFHIEPESDEERHAIDTVWAGLKAHVRWTGAMAHPHPICVEHSEAVGAVESSLPQVPS